MKKFYLIIFIGILSIFLKTKDVYASPVYTTFTYDGVFYNTNPSATNSQVNVKGSAEQCGITWTIFEDGMFCMSGNGYAYEQTAPGGTYEWSGRPYILYSQHRYFGIYAVFLKNFNSFANVTDIKKVYCDCVLYEECRELFDLPEMTSFKTGPNFDSSHTTSMIYMFYDASKLENADLRSFNTSKVTSFFRMFQGCTSIKTLDLHTQGNIWNTSSATTMYQMFGYYIHSGDACESLETLNLTGWNTSNVTNMSSMFCGCTKLKALNLTSFDTSKVTDIHCMFSRCESLKELDISSFDLSRVSTNKDGIDYWYPLHNSMKWYSEDTTDRSCYDSFLYLCAPYILKIPKRTPNAEIDLGRASVPRIQHPSKDSEEWIEKSTNYLGYDYYEEPSEGNPRFNNTLKSSFPVNLNQGSSPTITYYRKLRIEYSSPQDHRPINLLQQEYICPYDGYTKDTNRKATWLKQNYPDTCPYKHYIIENCVIYGDPASSTTSFSYINSNYNMNTEYNMENYLDYVSKNNRTYVDLYGYYIKEFKVTVPATFDLGSHRRDDDVSKNTKIKVAISSEDDNFWVSVSPALGTLSYGGKTYPVKSLYKWPFGADKPNGDGPFTDIIVDMPKTKVYYKEIKDNPDIGDDFRETELNIDFNLNFRKNSFGDVTPGRYGGTLYFYIKSGTDYD